MAIGFDLGILFHAKEHPAEFTNRMGLVLPVCSPESGGLRDPRRGTRLSIQEQSFGDRNFLWLLSLNRSFLIKLKRLDESAERVHRAFDVSELLAAGASGSRFFTVDETNFGTQLGTLCYLPKGHDPAVPFHLKDGKAWSDLLCIPCHGFTSDWHLVRSLKREKNQEEAVRSLATIDSDLLALLGDATSASSRSRRLGSPNQRCRLFALAEEEQLDSGEIIYHF